ncbi:Large cysteine-rich periplasmic protein omcB precursor [compost metagenome]
MNKNYSCQGRFLPYRQVSVMFRDTAVRIKKVFLLSFLLTIAGFSSLYADGSKDLYPSGVTGNRAFLYSNSYTIGGTTINSWPFKTLGTHYVYANVGETIAAASSAQNIGNGRIRLIAPNGSEYLTTATATGQIPNRNGELAGPQYPGQGAGGNRYLPYTVTVGAGQAGIWKVEFLPSGSETSSTTPAVTDTAADAAWTQGNNTELIAAWDVSVRNAANSAWISGRVYSNVFNLHIQGTTFTSAKAFYGKFVVLTRDGVAYRVTNNGSNGVGFTFFVNNKGFLDTTGGPSYKSLNISSPSSADFRVHDPRSQDDANNVTHKIFYTDPAADLPANAIQAVSTSSSTTTWLKNAVITPTASNLTYTGVEGTPNLSGNKGAYIGFDSNLAGTFRVEIIGDFPTRTITGNCSPGTNTVFWDGRDGAGNVLAPNTSIGEIRVQLFGAEVHFPFIDMEINPGGIIIEQLNESYALYTPNRDLVYWDDSNVTGGNANTVSNPTASGNAGISSNSNGHKWGRNSSGSSGSGNTGDGGSSFGNEKSLDTWSFVPGEVIIKTLDIIVASADLEVESITPSTTTISIGQTMNYQVVVKNNGPSDVTGAGFAFIVPAGFTITGVTYVNSQGTVVVVTGAVDPVTGNYIADLNMTNGSEIVFTITGTVGSSLAGLPLNVEGSIIRPADVTDIDATNPGTTPPTDPHLECLNGTAVENCNNIAYNNLNVAAIADLRVVKTANATVPTVGQQVTFTVAVTNNGPNAATGVTVADLMPTGFAFVSATVTVGTYNSGTGIWNVGTIANGATQTMTVTATVNATGNYTNVATATGTETDPVPGDNTDEITVAPDPDANLQISKTVNDTTPSVGDQVEFTLLVTNSGTANATNVIVTDQLPTGYTYVSHTAGTNYVPATGIWTIGSLANGASQTLVITATVNATGNYTNTASVDGDENDPDTTDNTDSVTTTPNNVIVADNDTTVTPVNGLAGGTAIANVLGNDTLNGAAIAAGAVNISVLPGAVPAGLAFNTATGAVTVNAGTPAGTYTFDYTICETINPTNCDTATVTVNVAAAPIVANNDTTATPVNGLAGGTAIPNVLTNDTLNGVAVVPSAVNISVLPGAVPAGLAFNTATGAVTVNAGTPAGTYTFDYTICEVLNPTNCDTATVTVNVAAAPIVANNDTTATPVNGYAGGTAIPNVLTNDTLNGVAVVPSAVTISVLPGAVPAGLAFNTATGAVTVDAETPAGTYTFDYTICEILNPTNCDTATVTVNVAAAPINAVNDNPTPVNGYTGDTDVVNVLTNDTLNGVPVLPSEVVVTVTTPASNPGVELDPATGTVSVDPQTPAGTYTIIYQLCEILNPTNCDSATVTVVVEGAPINAVNDTPAPVNGYTGDTDVVNVLDNDTLNDVPVIPSEVVVTVTTPASNPGVELDPATGTVSVDPQTPAGSYTIIYQLCEVLNPTNCDSATVTVVVEAAEIEANNDTNATPVNGYAGGNAIPNVLTNDLLNGVAVLPSQVTISVVPGSVPAGITFNTTTGAVDVLAGTAAGSYTFDYTICEILNPTNCDTATITVVVGAAPIDAVNDTPATPVNGYAGDTDVVNVLDNDTLNGVPVIPSEVVVTVTTPASNPGVELDPATGTVSVDPQTPAGTYTIVYQLCEILNPTNCDSATVTIVVGAAPIDAVNDTPAPVNGYTGDTDVVNVLDNDTLNGVPVIPSEVVVTVTTPASNPGVELDPTTGTVSVDPQTPAGTYTIVYQLCEILNPTNCDSATVTVVVGAAPIDAVNDTPAPVNGYTGDTDVVNVLDNDTLNGVPVIPSEVVVTVTTPASNPGVELDPATGTVSVDPQTPAGTYTIVYQLCEILNPTNCDSATVTVVVEAAPIDAVNDNPAPVNGYTGDPDVVNVLDNDTLNGVPVIPSEVVITVTTPSSNPGVELDPATGTVSVDPQTPAGTYTIVYQLCEILNPTNCETATVTIVVNPAPIDAVNDNPTPVNGYTGDPDVVNVLDNDTLNGVPVIPSEVVITVTTPSSNPGVELDPATGTVSVDPQTPAGTYTIVYQLCEILNPTNCETATVTIVVEEAPIDAVNDTPDPVNGYTGDPDVVNVLDNDTLNGVPVISSEVVVTVTTPSSNPGVELDPATGTVSVDPQTPAGTYTIIYQLCEILNPTNCETATVTIVVNPAPIDAVNDDLSAAVVNGNEGQVNAGNVFSNDTLNGVAVIPSEVTLTTITADAPLTLNADGTISVAAGTPAGTYTLQYSICEVLNPTNCDTATVTIVVQVPSIEITKTGTFNDANGDGFAQVGETITYNFSVVNTGSMQLTNITVTDPLVAVTGGPLAMLNAGATDNTTFTAIYTFTQADVDAGFVNNQALVSATPIVGQPITDLSDSNDPTLPGNDDPTVTTLPQNPSFQLWKEGTYQDANNDGIVNAGDVIEYDFTVTNTGNVTITNIMVTDPIVTVSGGPLASLAPQASDSTTFTATYTITQADIELGAVYNLALAEGTDPNGNPIDDESQDPSPVGTDDPLYEPTCPDCTVTILEQNPGIALIKTAIFNDENNNGIAEAGETITYNFTVTNTGNVSLSDVTINDPLPGVVVSGGPITLAVGQSDSTTFTATYAITQADINAGSVSNQAIATGRSPLGEEATDASDNTDNTGNNPTVIEIDGCTINVFNAVSPNNDGDNEILYIGGLECYPDNKVEIFNRWGVLVYEANGYNNNDKAFRGYSEGRVTVNKSEGLPDGTYFYFLKYKKPDGSVSEKSGYLYLSR